MHNRSARIPANLRFAFVIVTVMLSAVPTLSLMAQKTGQKPEWKGSMRTENGIVIVENPAEPLYKKAALILTEELSFGGKGAVGDSELLNVTSYDVDEAGNIFILDMKAFQIKSFDAQGRFIRKIGSRGQGPGEYDALYLVRVTKNNELVVVDAKGKIIRYSLDGRYLNEKMPSKMSGVIPFAMGDIDFVYGIRLVFEKVPGMEFICMDPDKDSIETIWSAEGLDANNKEIVAPRTQLICVVGEGNRLIWGMSDKYAFHIDDASGKRMKITRKAEPVRLTDSDKAGYEKAFEEYKKRSGNKIIIRDEFPFYTEFVSMPERIMVRTYEKSENISSIMYDVYDREGRYIAKIELPVKTKRLLFNKDKLYAVVDDDEGYPIIKRYSLKWDFCS